MGDKKKHNKEKDKKKDKKKEKDEKKKKKDKYSSQSDDSSSDSSDSSRSVSKKKDKKQKKIKKDKKSKKESSAPKETATSSNVPYDFSNVVPTNYPATIPGIKGMSIPVIPPPLPSVPNTTSAPKPRSKDHNIFKLLPKLHYGAVQFAKTIYSSQYLGESSLDKLLVLMTKNVEQTIKQENHKKGMAQILKCQNELEKIFAEEKEERAKEELKDVPRQKNNRYEILEKIYKESMKTC